MVTALEKEKEGLKQKREVCIAAMEKFKRENDVVSFGADRGNTGVERVGTLSASLTTAEMATFDLRAQLASVNAALANPATLAAFVEAQQFKSKETGDREYDDLRSQLIQEMLALSTSSALEGANNSRVKTLEAVVNTLRQRIAEKERSIAAAHLISVTTQLAAAEDNERQVREAMKAQRKLLIGLSPTAAAYANLDADVMRIQKQLDSLDARIAQVNVNELGAAPLNVQFLEPAHVEIKPIKPNKMLVLAAAMMLGWVLGIGLALGREWHDARFRSPQEIMALLGTSVLATVPRINGRLSSVARGQILFLDSHSPSAEAYRSIRTSLHLGAFRDAKTILLCSPTAGDGKSTTASNLAIAFAQAGQRTLLVDCDMREPVQHLIFETDGALGLSSVVAGEAGLRDVIQETRVNNLFLLPCGPVPANPTELLQGKRFGRLMRALVGSFDRIIIDSPPVTMVADARILAASADATLLVLRMHQSMHRTAMQSMDELEKVGAHVIGAIANDMPAVRSNTYYRGSWQYASSAKRVMASIARSEEEAVGGLRRLPAPGTLTIDEPDWSCDEQFSGHDTNDSASPDDVPPVAPGAKGVNSGREW
jgi:capsular exopolysaccharide synthesis family protein